MAACAAMALGGALGACSDSDPGGTDATTTMRPSPAAASSTSTVPKTTTSVVTSEVPLTGRRFWFGDGDGSLFEADLTSAALTRTGDGRGVVLTGTATNLLGQPAPFPSDATLDVGKRSRPLTTSTESPIAPGESASIRLVADGVPDDLALADATATFGAKGTNQSVVPLSSATPVTSTAPRLDVIRDPQVTGSLPDGATATITGSVLYPRYASARTGDRRLEVAVDLAMPQGGPPKGLYLHPYLTDASGIRQSVGDQNVFPPGNHLLEHAILTEGSSGPLRLTFLEVATNADLSFTFAVD